MPSSGELEEYPLAQRYKWHAVKSLESKPLKPNKIEKYHAQGTARARQAQNSRTWRRRSLVQKAKAEEP